MRRFFFPAGYMLVSAMAVAGPLATVCAQPQAQLFDSIDENMNPVSMADMIDGRPLVLCVGSCT